ncbi:hypothetical protein BCR33DRAFT_781546 [Rhizoclosmatium globosum]|uniref:ABC transporter domain-containing protein n=1 Tax=Rhizoclosmatium globosum TaxID=329046 RepID=A0A1Y2CSM6_9FUNG|nr:hypothetical protein BCR33DRAFT_781546 [Rhizoclosmatium globosum]|eukprot:ORY50039.1 hypothetical protein BCR33DRAFT_781546 [Rhizoclosmatium globosum]
MSLTTQFNASLLPLSNPFLSVAGPRKVGSPWQLAKIPAIPKELGPGYGCFQDPYVPVGYRLDFTFNGSLPVTAENACRPGFFCPYLDIANPATYPVQCPPSTLCFLLRSYGRYCDEPQGVFEPMVCPKGFYCPDYKTVTSCWHYCLSGQTSPTPCEFLSICPAGTVVQQHYGFLAVLVAVDVILVTIYWVLRFLERRRIKRQENSFEMKKVMNSTDIQRNISALTAGSTRALMVLDTPGWKSILQGVTGSINAGRMTAIMGPSGAGKTTFMNVLMGKAAELRVLEDQRHYCRNGLIQKLIGYVPQDDTMIEELSVRENIRYSARVRLPNSWTNAEVNAHVEAFTSLNLSHVADKRIGNVLQRGISVVKKACQHWDGTCRAHFLNILHSISRLGLTIVAVVHQPRVEIFETFDDVLMIAPGEELPTLDQFRAKPYLNPLNGVPQTQLNIGNIADQWTSRDTSKKRPSSISAAETSIASMYEIAKKRGASYIRQIGLSHNRGITQQTRMVGGFIVESMNGLAAGAVMGVSALGGETFAAHLIHPGVNVFGPEKAVYLREAEAGHSASAYYIGKNLSAIPRILFASAHFFSLYYFLAQPPIAIGIQFAFIFLNFFGVYGFGMIMSMFISQQNAPLIAVCVGLISEVLCGFGPSLTDATDYGIIFFLNIGLNRWASEAQFWEWAKPSYGFEDGNTSKNMLVMLALGFGYRLIAYTLFLVALNSGFFRSRHHKQVQKECPNCLTLLPLT